MKCDRCGTSAAAGEVKLGSNWSSVGISALTKPFSFTELFAALRKSDGAKLCPQCSDELREFFAAPVERPSPAGSS
jgi:hypothetical protein